MTTLPDEIWGHVLCLAYACRPLLFGNLADLLRKRTTNKQFDRVIRSDCVWPNVCITATTRNQFIILATMAPDFLLSQLYGLCSFELFDPHNRWYSPCCHLDKPITKKAIKLLDKCRNLRKLGFYDSQLCYCTKLFEHVPTSIQILKICGLSRAQELSCLVDGRLPELRTFRCGIDESVKLSPYLCDIKVPLVSLEVDTLDFLDTAPNEITQRLEKLVTYTLDSLSPERLAKCKKLRKLVVYVDEENVLPQVLASVKSLKSLKYQQRHWGFIVTPELVQMFDKLDRIIIPLAMYDDNVLSYLRFTTGRLVLGHTRRCLFFGAGNIPYGAVAGTTKIANFPTKCLPHLLMLISYYSDNDFSIMTCVLPLVRHLTVCLSTEITQKSLCEPAISHHNELLSLMASGWWMTYARNVVVFAFACHCSIPICILNELFDPRIMPLMQELFLPTTLKLSAKNTSKLIKVRPSLKIQYIL